MIKLKIVSIFLTIDGEVTLGGALQWSTFIRFGGCNLRCWKSTGFCDAPHSLSIRYPYPEWDLNDVVKTVQSHSPCRRVTITGGEPMLQAFGACTLSSRLRDLGYLVSIETSGSIEMSDCEIGAFDCVIMDVKPPSTEMDKLNKAVNMGRLRPHDFVKFVLQDKADFYWALEYLRLNPTDGRIAFGPRYNYLQASELVEWLRNERRFDIQLNLQMHKSIWPECHPIPVESLKEVDVHSEIAKEH